MDKPRTEPFYFGCWQRVGHDFYTKGMIPYRFGPPTPWGWSVEKLTDKDNRQHMVAKLHYKDGWTALAAHDYSVDHRGNSKSVFCFPDTTIENLDIAWERARNIFPEVVVRMEIYFESLQY